MSNNTTLEYLFVRYPSINAILEEFAPAGPMAEKIIPPIWYALGFIGNPISAVIWLGQRMRRNNSSAIYLGALSISDMVFLLLNLLYIVHVAWGYDVYNDHIICEIFHFIYYVPQYLSTFLVLGFTAERYVAVCYPFLKEKWCTVRRAAGIVAFLVMFSIALSSAQSYIWTYSPPKEVCEIRPGALIGDEMSFWNLWTWVTDILAFGLVPLIVLFFNILVLKEICKISRNDLVKRQQSRQTSSTASTLTLLAVSFYLIVTQFSATILVCLQHAFPYGDPYLSDREIREDALWSNLFSYLEVRKIVEVLCLSHYSCYFFIYCLTGKHFRKEVVFLATLQGRLPFLATLLSRRRGKEHYSMVSTNGGHMSETFTTNFSTTM
ncbi:unnamed protein product [Lymnaea stagnalis]|uniref:G-protein coupled receptors family 1 profile domain-containing protein n=1 Tax=Lymnaea stagnalis TaxID=6523 RepID=A0AAV2H137_LYMST